MLCRLRCCGLARPPADAADAAAPPPLTAALQREYAELQAEQQAELGAGMAALGAGHAERMAELRAGHAAEMGEMDERLQARGEALEGTLGRLLAASRGLAFVEPADPLRQSPQAQRSVSGAIELLRQAQARGGAGAGDEARQLYEASAALAKGARDDGEEC